MELYKISLKAFNFLFPFADFLYILQLEEYDSQRLVKWLPKFFWRRNFQVRDNLKFTRRVKLTLAMAINLWLLSFVLFAIGSSKVVSIALLGIWLVLVPLFVLLGNLLLLPYFEWLKTKIRAKATEKVFQLENLKAINVAGSYGKTTTKNFIHQLIGGIYRTQMIPGNINTPAGIAEWVNNQLLPGTQVLIAEMDTYRMGEIGQSSQIIPADIAVLTNIGDQHLERFMDQYELAQALAEVFIKAKPKVALVSTSETISKLTIPKNVTLHLIGKSTEYLGKKLNANKLSLSNQTNLKFALKVCELLNIPHKYILKKITKLELPDRRQKPIQMYGYDAIDDSYNISFTTAVSSILTAKKMANENHKKLLVLTAGIPELSKSNEGKNTELGKFLSGKADHIIVLGSMFAEEIIAGGDQSTMTKVPDLRYFLTKTRLDFSPEKWFLLHLPELSDLYY